MYKKTLVSLILNKQRLCQHRRHPKIGIVNFGCILHHSTRVRKQKTLKILCFTVCVEDDHKLTQTKSVIQSVPRQSDVHVDENSLTGFVVSKTKNIQRLSKIFSAYFQRL